MSDISFSQGVYIYKPNAARADSSARAGNYLSYSRIGSTTKVLTKSGKTVSITKFQPSLFLTNIDPYKHGVIRVSNLAGFESTYAKYLSAYNTYSSSRPYLKTQVEELKKVIDHLKLGEGYYNGSWRTDKSIDDAIALKEQLRLKEKRKNALAYLPRLKLLNGKVYKEVMVKKKLYNTISFSHEFGASSAKYDQLPRSLRNKLGEFKIEIEARESLAREIQQEKDEARLAAERKIEDEKRRILANIRKQEEEKRNNQRRVAELEKIKHERKVFEERLPSLLESIAAYETRLLEMKRPTHTREGMVKLKRGIVMNVTDEGLLLRNTYDDEIFFVECSTGAIVDGEHISGYAYRSGVFKYTAVSGNASTVAKYIRDESYDEFLKKVKIYSNERSQLDAELQKLRRELTRGRGL